MSSAVQCPLHWQADSEPLRHQGNPYPTFYLQTPLGKEHEKLLHEKLIHPNVK